MPYLQLDVNGRHAATDKRRLAQRLCETYAAMMSVDIRRISVAVREAGGKWIVEGKAWPADAAEPVPDTHSFPPYEGRHDRARVTINKLQPHQGDLIHSHAVEYEVDGGTDRTPLSPTYGWMGWVHDNAFGDLWCRPHLTDPERERATTAALVVLRMGQELRGHFEANISFGFTPEEIGEGILQLAPYVGYPTIVHAMLLAGEVIRTFTPPAR